MRAHNNNMAKDYKICKKCGVKVDNNIDIHNCYFPERAPKTQEEAREYAIDWQKWQAEQSLSYGELAEWGDHFREIAEEFDLVEEFKENGII